MKNNHIALYVDLLFCLIIMPLTIMLLPVDRWIVHNTAFLLTLIAYIYIIYFIYRWVCLPKLFMQKKYIRIAGLLITLTATTWLFTYFPVPSDHTSSPRQMEARMNMRTQTIWFFFLMVTGFSLAIELTFELFRQILAKQEIAAEKNKAELALYKAQINPHFMFNTLNMLYALVLSGSDKTESAFVKFSNILRYMYAQTHSENIPIGQEIEYIRQYTDLQKLRLNHHTRVTLTAQTDNETTPVPSMIFITFVENAFKYGTSADTDCNIQINMPTKTLHAEKIHTHSWLTDHFNCNNMAVHLFSCTIRPYKLTTANGSQNEYAHTNNMVLFSHGNRIFACNRTDIRTI